MAYREIEMWEVLEVLRRIHRGEKQRPMARVTGIARTTIRRYEQVARELGWVPELFEPDEALALAITRQLRPGAKEAKPGAAEALLLPHRERIKQWLVRCNALILIHMAPTADHRTP